MDVFPTDERTGRLAGSLLGRAGGVNAVDAMVAAEAVTSGADVMTGDVEDLLELLAEYPSVRVIGI